MSYKKKQANIKTSSQPVEQIQHEYLILEKRGDIINLTIKPDLDPDWSLTLNNFLEDNVHYDKKRDIYQVKQKDLASFLNDIKSLYTRYASMKEKRKSKKSRSRSHSDSSSRSHSRSHSGSSSESESTDDELIQQTLTRKLKYESKGDIIPDEAVSDSEMEDVISLCRRMRYLYTEIKQLKQKVAQLETKT